ncbi:MAG TPA: tetratricopeptide repeat protein [Anaerolineales bacterium]|nr:tetratricopeptide repeat protein [Anaerolineales bacterium]
MRTETKAEQRFENMVTIMIASVAIWVAITAYFQNYAANISDQARRRAQQYSIEATKKEVNGVIQYSYEWQGAFQTWEELSWQITAAEQNGDTKAADRYRKIQERIVSMSKMLAPQYFDPAVAWPEYSQYEAESYLIESTRLSETYLAEAELGNATDSTADALIVQITLLTVSLSLYGLSMALKGRVRWLFVLIGSGIVGLCVLWLGWSLLELLVRPEVNEAAIRFYAEGVGLEYQGRYEEAIDKFTDAVTENPYYAKAYYERGLSYYELDNLTTAIAEMEEARNQGLNDININWNLGWTYYLAGDYAKAIETNERILSEHPEVLGMRMNQAISYLAAGDLTNSQAQYDLLIGEALNQVSIARQNGEEPSASLWYYMDAGALDLENLIYQLDNNPRDWTQAPTANLITGDHNAIRSFAFEQMKRLKESTTSLEYTGQLPVTQGAMQISSFIIGKVTETDADGFITGFEPAANSVIPYGEKGFSVEYVYSGQAPKQLIWKVYRNGYEDQSLRVVSNFDISGGTTWYQTFGYQYDDVFILADGEYIVEFYADNILVQRGTFYVQ